MRIPATPGLCFALVIPAILLYMAGMAEAQLACHQCHGSEAPTDSRPLDAATRDISTGGFQGKHRTHIPPGATVNSCSVCHSGNDSYTSSHRNGSIEMSSNINQSTMNAVYRNGSSGFLQTSTPKLGSCSNVNCHFERTTLNWGENKLTVPEGCGTCHGAPPAGGDSGAAGSHSTHDRYYKGANGCSQCHINHLDEAAPFAHATTAGRRPLIIALRDPQGSLKGTYNGPLHDYLPRSQDNQFGSCRSTYCHTNGTSVSVQTSFSRISSPTWGAATGTVTCDACHSYPPAYPNGSKANRHGRHSYFGYSCSRCHYSTTNDGSTISDPTRHVNRQYNVDAPPGESLSYSYSASGGSCNNSYCHSSAQGINDPTQPPTYVTVQWNYQLSPGCNSCHRAGYHPFGTGFEMGSGSHAKHLRYLPTQGCAACHFTAQDRGRPTCWQCHVVGVFHTHVDQSTRGPEHVNGVIDVAIHPDFPNPGATGSYSGDGIPRTAYGNCSNLYCHSQGTSGTAPYPAANMPSVQWGGQPMPADCTGCHNGDQNSALPMATGSHGSHQRFDCIRCHNRTVTGNRSTIENSAMAGNPFYPEPSKHGNGSVELSFNPSLGGTYAGNSSKPAGSAYGKCLNVYCHSPGTSVATGSVMAGYSTPAWGTSRTLACDACHGNPPLYPDTRPKANDHDGSHAGMNCSLCHYLTTADGTTISSPAKHADMNYDVAPAPGTQFSYTFAANGGSCGTVSCHAENIIPRKWNSTTCNNCHGTPPSDAAHLRHFTGTSRLAAYGKLSSTTSFTYNCGTCHPVNSGNHQDNTTQVELYDPAAPAGTRKALQPVTANYTAGICTNTYCHSPGTSLATGSTPVSSIAWTDSPLSCAGCHGNPPAYGNGTPKSNSHAAHNGFGCKACHAAVTTTGTTVTNPLRHIDGTYDVAPPDGSSFNYSFATSGGSCSSLTCHSDGTAISTQLPVTAATNATWGGPSLTCTSCHAMPPLYGNKAPKSNSHASHVVYGCQACHYPTTTDGIAITNRSLHGNGVYEVGGPPGTTFTAVVTPYYYTTCYFDSGCHNDGTDIATGKTVAWNSSFWGRGVLPYGCASCHGMPPAYANGTPKTNSHVSHTGYGCQECHYSVTTNGSSIGTPAKHANKQYDIAPGSGRSFSYTFSSTGSSCAAVTCHHDGTFVATAIRSNSIPLTTWGTALGCTGCHGNPPAYPSDAPKKNSHQGNHAALGCQACHLAVTTNGTAITTPAKHGNNAYDVGNGSSFIYTFSTSGSSCSNISCHSDGTVVLTGTLRSATTTSWGGPALGCAGCHGNPPAYPSYNPKRNSHLGGHATYGCQVCHYSVTTNGITISTPANHKNNAYEVSPGPTGSFSYDGNGVCSSVVCHDDGTRITTGIARSSGTAPQWGWSKLNCNNCHDSHPDYPNGAPKANSHPRHVSNAGNRCQYCHADTTSDGYTISNPAKHKNSSFDLQGGSGRSFSYTYSSSGGNCSAISCHGDGTAVATGIVRSPVAATWGGASLACDSCHGTPPGYANGTPKKNSHLQHDSFGCQRCHFGTTSNGTSVNSYYHGNNAYDVAGQAPVTINYTYAASGGSCTATCHGNGTQVVTGIRQGGYNPVWGGANPGCTACHGGPPTYQDGTPKANSHVAHGSYSCKVCHANVVSDNTTISDRTRHGNSSYDLQGDGTATFDYTFRIGGSSCANVSCHTIAPASTNWSMYAQAPASLTPANGSTSQSATAAITAVFGEEMDPATINATTFKVTDGVTDVAGDVSYDTQTRTATFTPTGGLLDYSNFYTATVTNGIKNARGATFPLTSYSWSFSTARSANYQAIFITNFGIKGNFASTQNFNNAPYIGEDYWKVMAYYQTGYVALPGMTDYHVKVMEATKANAELRSSITDLSQYQSGTLTFTYNIKYSSPSVADVDVSINGTDGPWTNIWRKSNPFYAGYSEINTVSMNISPLIKRQANVVIRFRFTPSTPLNTGHWAVDNITLYGDHN